MFFILDKPVDLIVILTELLEGIGHFLLFFVTSLPRWYEIVRFEKGALFDVRGSDVQSVLVEHDSLAFHDGRLSALLHKYTVISQHS